LSKKAGTKNSSEYYNKSRALRINGWLHNANLKGDNHNITIRNGQGYFEIRVPDGYTYRTELKEVNLESTMHVVARKLPEGDLELVSFEVVHPADSFPLEKGKDYSTDLEVRHLWLRSDRMRAIVRGRHKIFKAIRESLEANNFITVQTPVTTAMECVCGGTIFKIPFYDQEVYLNQSPWMYGGLPIN